MNAKVRWALIIIGFLVSNALAMGFLVLASTTSRAEVIPDYYEKAARFDETMELAARERANACAAEMLRDLASVLARGVE